MRPEDRKCKLIDQIHEYVMQGVVVAFRVVDGCLRRGDVIQLMNTKKEYQVDEVGVRTPAPVPVGAQFSCALSTCSTLSDCSCVAMLRFLTHFGGLCFEASAAQIPAP